MTVKRRLALASSFLLVVLVVTVVVSSAIGTARIPAWQVVRIALHRLPLVGERLIAPDWPSSAEVILFQVRLPRIVLAVIVGAALSAAGTAFQGLLRNSLADPYIVGVSAGAALGAALGIVFRIGSLFGYLSPVPILAFAGALVTMVVIYNLARVGGRVPVETLLLAGVVVGSFLWAIVSFIMAIAGESLPEVVFWLMGSLSGRNWSHVVMVLPYIVAGIFVLLVLSRDFNLIALGEESARQLGLETETFKKIVMVAGSLITAASVSVSGIIGFVGLMTPHVMRMILGPDHRVLMPASILAGGAFLVAADTVARMVLSPMEIPVGVITAMLGGPFFLYILRRRRKEAIF